MCGRWRAATREPRPVFGQVEYEVPATAVDVPPTQRAQERSQRGQCPDPVEQLVHPAVPQRVQIFDGIGTGSHPGHDRGDLRRRVRPTRPLDGHVLAHPARPAHSVRPAASPAPAHHKRPGAPHRKSRGSCRQHAKIALTRCPLDVADGSLKNSHHPTSKGTLFISGHFRPKPDRWMRTG